MGFIRPNQPLKVETLDGFNAPALEPLPFRLADGRYLRAKAGATSDGLSSPKFAKCNLQDGRTYFPARAHDAGYRDELEQSLDEGATWQPVTLGKTDCDNLLLELCRAQGVPEMEAQTIYNAVKYFGQSSFAKDRANVV